MTHSAARWAIYPRAGCWNLRTSTRTSASSRPPWRDVHRVQIAFVQHGFGDAPLGVFVRAMPAGLMTMSLCPTIIVRSFHLTGVDASVATLIHRQPPFAPQAPDCSVELSSPVVGTVEAVCGNQKIVCWIARCACSCPDHILSGARSVPRRALPAGS
jgi:hypothetical protein